MPHVTTDDGVRLYYEEAGSGYPIVFVHEFAGDYRSYETQLRFFSRRYHCIAFNARGYPPSDVPEDWQRYSQERARDDIRDVLDGLGLAKAHIVGISMGGFAVLHFGFAYPNRRARRFSEYGACPQYRGAGSLQPDDRRFLPPSRDRALAAPRPALGHRLDFGDVKPSPAANNPPPDAGREARAEARAGRGCSG